MKIKPLAYLKIFLLSVIFFSTIILAVKNINKNPNWQLLIEKQIGNKSVLNVGKNLSFDETSIYFSDTDRTIYSINKETGQTRWTTQMNDHSPFQVTLDHDSVYVASFDSHIYKINKNDGSIVWSFAIPNQFWPDTEVIVDNDSLIFFADRAGILRAIDKESGLVAWEKAFNSIDSSKIFVPNSIHFGFLSQNDSKLIADHFPSKTTFEIDKQNGTTLNQQPSLLKINWPTYKNVFSTADYDLLITSNVIHQPIFELFDKEKNSLWSYQTENRVNEKEIYQDGDRLYYLDATNRLLTSLKIDSKNPNKQKFIQLNFKILEDFSSQNPFKKLAEQHNQQIDFVPRESLLRKTAGFLTKTKLKIKYFLANYQKITTFPIVSQEKTNYLELTITHDQNFYENPFTALEISAEFNNPETKQKIEVKGFYYDFNLWKVRAKLSNGNWQWQSTIKTPFWTNHQSGNVLIVNGKASDQSFFTLGIQDVIVDQNMDGNPLNQMGYAKTSVPPTDPKQYSYLDFPAYLDLYKDEAGINLFRYGPDNWAPAIWKNLANVESFAMDVNGNLQGDIIVDEANKRDLQVMMSIFAFYPPYTSPEAIADKNNQQVLEKYLDYVIARYAASINIWELANEALPSLEWQNFISDYLAKHDPYQHPITTSLEETRLNNSELLSIHLYTHPKNNKELVEVIEKLLNKPRQEQNWQGEIIISELGFKDANYSSGSAITSSSADLMRKMAWIFAFQKVGVVFWNTGTTLFQNTDNANIYLGPQERLYLKKLQEFLPKTQTSWQSNFQITKDFQFAIYSLKNEQSKLFYLLNLAKNNYGSKNSHQVPLEISGLKIDEANAIDKTLKFIDPSTNLVIKTIIVSKDTAFINLPNFEEDLAIKVD